MLYHFQHAAVVGGPEAGGEMIQTTAFEVEYLDLRGQAVLVDTGAEVEVEQKPPPNIIKVQLPQHALPPNLPRTVVTTQPAATTVTVVQPPVKKKPKQQQKPRYK